MKGSLAIVSGASRGIGRAVVGRLGQAGWRCLCVGTTPGPDSVCQDFVRADLSDPVSVARASAELEDILAALAQPCDLLVNNAGGAWPRRADSAEAEDVARDLTLNLYAPILLTRLVLGGMLRADAGSIVNVASTAGRTGVAFLSAYSAAKAGLIAFTQAVAAECAGTGVRVNCVCPGSVETDGAARGRRELSRLHGLQDDHYQAAMKTRTGLLRLVRPVEVAETVYWLATASGAVNGQTINVCGTSTMS